ncbi:MAG: glycine cleavage system aminomethyltransferase GcvT [Phycisphaerae bacterium]|jgi:aminomethyltransferase
MLKTALNEFHRQHGARLVEFAGWEMPVVYQGIIEEHVFTREHGTVFDVSHMGRVEFRGEQAEALLQRLATRNVAKLKIGQCGYSHMCKEDGGILDDVIVSRFENHFVVVCNASNREKLLGWFDRQRAGFNVDIKDRTFETAMVALQGPEIMETLGKLLPLPLDDLKRYHARTGQIMGTDVFVARSGYTGEDGVEIVVPANVATAALDMLLSRAEEMGRPIKPAGLGARDTLRLEAGMPLYGHELTEDWDPITAGQTWCVDLNKDFIGQPVLKRVADEGPRRQVVGFEIAGKRIARPGSVLQRDGKEVGIVTSGTQAPSVGKNIAMGMLDSALKEPGTTLQVDIRGTRAEATVVPLPFYKRPKA